MGYSPKHAKPVSLRSTALKNQHRPFGPGGTTASPGRHRAGSAVPVPRFPVGGAVQTEEHLPAIVSEAHREPAGEPAPAADAGQPGEPDAARAAEHAEALKKLIPSQRVPLRES